MVKRVNEFFHQSIILHIKYSINSGLLLLFLVMFKTGPMTALKQKYIDFVQFMCGTKFFTAVTKSQTVLCLLYNNDTTLFNISCNTTFTHNTDPEILVPIHMLN